MSVDTTFQQPDVLDALLIEHQGDAPLAVEGLDVEAEEAHGVNLRLASQDELWGVASFMDDMYRRG